MVRKTDPAPKQPRAAPETQAPPRTETARAAGASRHLVPENAAEFIYGVITIGAVMAAESGAHDSYAETFASALVATLLYWVARAYTDLLGHRLEGRERLTAGTLGRELVADWAIVRGASLPLLGLLIAWIAGATRSTGVTVALYTAVVTVVLFELIAGIRAKSTPRELIFKTSIGVAMGLGILAMKGILR